MGKPLQIVTIALAISIATFIQAARAYAANDVECVRKSHSSIGFTSIRAFDAWFPKTIYLYRNAGESIEGGRLKFGDESGYYIKDGKSYWLADGIKWEMLPDGRLFAHFPQKGGYVQILTQRYLCNATVEDFLASR